MKSNPFFSSVLRVQRDRGHRVATGGPYRFVRHPGYAFCLFYFAGIGPALGSWAAALAMLPALPALLVRTAREDRMLLDELEGYPAYARNVRWRLVPGLW